MGWQDREYARGADFEAGWTPGAGVRFGNWWRRSVIHALILVNVGVFVLDALMSDIGPSRGGSPLVRWGVLSAPDVLSGQVWRLLTATFLHAGVMHLFFNMLGLFFFGRAVEERWGRRTTLALYLGAGVLANVMFVALASLGLWGPRALGASGCVLAMMGAAAVLTPNRRVYLMWGALPVPMYLLAIVLGGGYLLNAIGGGFNAGGDAVHVVGLLIGAGWAWRGASWWARVGAARGAPVAVRVRRSGASESPPIRGWQASSRERDQEALDALLAQVRDKGIAGLTEAQRRELQQITERMRGDYAGG